MRAFRYPLSLPRCSAVLNREATRFSPLRYCQQCASASAGMTRKKEGPEMAETDDSEQRRTQSDALVLFGVTGDLAYKKIFPALYAMTKKGLLDVPVVGVASTPWNIDQLRERATDAVKHANGEKIDDRDALSRLLSLLKYIDGD